VVQALELSEPQRAQLAYILLQSIKSAGIARSAKAAWDADIAARPEDEACCEVPAYDRLKPRIVGQDAGIDLTEITGMGGDSGAVD